MDHPEHPTDAATDGQEAEGGEGGGDRVAKALARAGVASRRDVERMIAEGRVALNGEVLTTPAVKVSAGDLLTVDGEVVNAAEPTRLFRYHKPTGLLTTHNDPEGRPDVFARLPAGLPRLISVGRLDINSEGLLLLTNDGELARVLELPKNGWVRRYRARAFGSVTQEQLDTLKAGVTVDRVRYGSIEARIDKASETERGSNVWISIAITEGKNREVRKVLDHLGLQVNRLIRVAYGPFQLGDLGLGGVAEVGPRVIREQLGAFLPEDRQPTGSGRGLFTYEGESGGRRPSSGAGGGESRKPRGAPDDRRSRSAGDQRPARPPKKPGWAKAAPRHSHGDAPPRRRSAPSGAYGSREAGAGSERLPSAPGERPRGGKPSRRPFGERPGSGPRRGGDEGSRGPRLDRGDRAARPPRDRGEDRGDRPPPRERPEGAYGSRSASTGAARPDARSARSPRSGGAPARDERGEGKAYGERPGRPARERRTAGEGPRGSRPDGARPRGPRPDGDRPRGPRPNGDGPRGARPDGDRPRGPRPEGGGSRGKPSGPRGKPTGRPPRTPR